MLRAVTVLLIQEARKLTLGQKIVHTSHTITTVVCQKGGHWLSPSCMLKYQTVLVEQEDVELKVTTVVNPAQVLNIPKQGEEQLTLHCLHRVEQVCVS